METARIAQLLGPFLGDERLSERQLTSISVYIDVLLKWNARMNLTAIREPEQIVERHFGESLFAARHLVDPSSSITVADIGSGAGFPGIPIKIYARQIHLTLIEAHGKKATFLREVGRALSLTNIDIFAGRAEQWGRTVDLVTLRAVERFEAVLPAAVRLVSPEGSLGLLIGAKQASQAEVLVKGRWERAVQVPGSHERVLKVLKSS
jgi:16S rRNA (guanine527-N7)-methyltransferase